MRLTLRLLLPAVALMMSGCVGELADLVTLQKNLVANYPDSEIGVNLKNRRQLQITLNNGAALHAGENEQEEIARDIGRLALELYPAAARLEQISVVFGARHSAGPVEVNSALYHYDFTPDELSRDEAPPAEEVAGKVAAGF